MLTVLYVLHSTFARGGASLSFVNMLVGLREHGVCPIVALPDKDGLYGVLRGMGVETVVAPIRDNVWPVERGSLRVLLLFFPRVAAHLIYIRRAVAMIVRAMRGRHIDLVHSNSGVVNVGEKVAKRLGVPHVYHIREYQDKDFGLHYFPLRRYFRPRRAICITADLLAYFRLGDRGRVIYNGIFPASYEPACAQDDGRYFLYAGRIEPCKGVRELVEGYADYVHTLGGKAPLPLLIAGKRQGEAYAQAIETYARKEGIGGSVRWIGERGDLPALMCCATATIVSSFNEGFGRVMPEAMFNRCPFVGYDSGGTKEQFDNGLRLAGEEIGLRYTRREELAAHLAGLHRGGKSAYAAMTRRAARTVHELYSIEANAEAVWTAYQDIINQRW